MRTLRVRLTVLFSLSFLAVTAVFMFLTYRDLDLELRRKTFQREYNINPNWILHGSYSEEEVRAIMTQLLISSLTYSIPLILVTLTAGYVLARKSLTPIISLNEQLQVITPATLQKRVSLPEADEHLTDLVEHLNEMLARLEDSFAEMSEYAAKVAHELRTPLTILRLKVEQSEGRIEAVLAEELQSELHRLAHVVDQSLLIAKAEQGRLAWNEQLFDASALLVDLARDFHFLASEEGRAVRCWAPASCHILSDVRHCKQILHALLTNSMIHGIGTVFVRLQERQGQAHILVLNEIRPSRPASDLTLGLGLRVVRALLSRQPGITFLQRSGPRWHASLIRFPQCQSQGEVSTVSFTKKDFQ